MSDRHRIVARRHAMRRAWQRFGLAIGEGELKIIEQQLVAGKFEWVADLSGCCVVYRGKFRGRVIFPVFNIGLWSIVTFLPSSTWAKRWAIRSS